jgi:hypothetical protein
LDPVIGDQVNDPPVQPSIKAGYVPVIAPLTLQLVRGRNIQLVTLIMNI